MKPATPSVYLIKPKYIFKTPFLKYDLQNPTNRQAQNEELTEYFNYGFNEDTMNIYVKLVNRMLKVLDHKKNLEYFDEPSELMRLNDEIPMDLGGFCKFYDPQLFKNDYIQNDEELLKNFLFNIVKASWINGKQLPTYPMLEFVKSMYPPKPSEKQGEQQQNSLDFQDNPLPLMIGQISKNLQKKYQQTMLKLIEQKNQPKQSHPSTLPFKKTNKFEKRPRFQYQQQTQEKPQQRKSYKQRESYKQRQKQSYKERESYKEKQKEKEKGKEKERGKEKQKQKEKYREKKKRGSSSSSSSSESSSSGTSSDSSSESSEVDRRRKRKDRKESRRDDRKDDRRQSSRRKDKRSGQRDKRSGQRDRKATKERTQSRHGSSRYDERERERKQKRRSRSRDHKRSRR